MDIESLATVYNRTTDKLNFEGFILVSLEYQQSYLVT